MSGVSEIPTRPLTNSSANEVRGIIFSFDFIWTLTYNFISSSAMRRKSNGTVIHRLAVPAFTYF